MRKKLIIALATLAFALAASAIALAQTTTKTIQNPDGTYTIIEYPVGKEVAVTLNPVSLPGASGTMTVLRDPTGTTIKLNVRGLPTEVATLNVYAIDPDGAATLIGPMTVADGTGVISTTARLDKFMVVASPDTIANYTPETKIYFRSAVPEGFAVVPFTSHPVAERVAAVATTEAADTSYAVPMLNIPDYRTGKETKLKVNFSGVMEGARANVFIEPHKDGRTEVNFRFHDLKDAPHGMVYTVWAVSPDNKFEKLGQILNSRGRNEAEIKGETSLSDFGLLVTMETAGEISRPAGARVSWVEVVRP